MTIRFFRFLTLFACLLCTVSGYAQDRPIGVWRSLLPYNSAKGVATDGETLYAISEKAFFTWNTRTLEVSAYSKVDGMHEIGTSAIAHDVTTGTTIIGYDNSNIDLFRHNNFIPIPYIKTKSFSGSKSINNIYALNGLAYVSTGLGVVVIDLDLAEVRETYVFNKGGQTITINAFIADSSYFYAATSGGLYKTLRSNPTPQAFSSWQAVETSRAYTHLATVKNNLYAAARDTVYRLNVNALQRVYSKDSFSIIHIDGGDTTLYIGLHDFTHQAGRIYHLSLANGVIDSTWIGIPEQVVETTGGRVWIADLYQGLGERANVFNLNKVLPEGPNDPSSSGLYAHNGELWVSHGGANPTSYNPLGDAAGLSQLKDGHWKLYNPSTYPLLKDSMYDFMDVIKDERDGTIYAGTYNNGLLELKADGTGRIIKQGELFGQTGNANAVSAFSSAIDANGNLVVSQGFTPYELAIRLNDGSWNHYSVPPYGRAFRLAAGLVIDDFNQKWYYTPLGGGVIVYNDNNTPENTGDDASVWLNISKGTGNLPSNTVRCMAKDRDGAIWIGTDAGVGIVNCPGGAIDRSCEAEQRVVQFDQFAGHLFSSESVRAITVDGANRKWIGTTNGVWLLSPDANKVVYRFTTDNSPLPSNIIQKIAVDGVTGDVYIGTEQGLISFRSTATDGGTTNSTVQTFPNPVPSGYTGQIAIRGLVTDADVRITDIAGQLIYRTKALGGQAVWNGLDYTGKRPRTGVLLIFITNKDGLQTSVGKMMFMN